MNDIDLTPEPEDNAVARPDETPTDGSKVSLKDNSKKSRISKLLRSEPIFYFLAALAPFVTLWAVSDIYPDIYVLCLSDVGDIVMQAPYAKSIMDGESWGNVQRLGAPHGHNLFNFPMNSHIDFTIYALFAKITGCLYAAHTYGYMIRSIFAGLLMTWSLRNLRISRPVAISASVLFALIPYYFIRMAGHFNLSIYFIPVTCSLALLCLTGRFKILPRRTQILYLVLCFFIGLNGPYTSYFSCIMLALATVGAFWRSRRMVDYLKNSIIPVSAIFLILIATLIGSIPGMLAFEESPRCKEILQNRSASDCDLFGLRVSNMITPLPHHRIPILGRFGQRMHEEFKPHFEGGSEYIGLIASIGFLFLLFSAARHCVRPPERLAALKPPSSDERINASAIFVIALILIGTIGGFSNFVAITFSTIRSYARIAVPIAFFSLFALAILADRLRTISIRRAGPKRQRVTIIWTIGLALIALLGAKEQQLGALLKYDQEAKHIIQAKDRKLREFLSELERILPKGAMVYQYPDVNQQGNMLIYEHMKAYFLSNHLRFSYVWLDARGDKTYEWLDAISKLSLDKQAEALLLAGFDAIWIERKAYEDDGDYLIKYYSALPHAHVYEHIDEEAGNVVMIDLRLFRRLLTIQCGGVEEYRKLQLEILKDPTIVNEKSPTDTDSINFPVPPPRKEKSNDTEVIDESTDEPSEDVTVDSTEVSSEESPEDTTNETSDETSNDTTDVLDGSSDG